MRPFILAGVLMAAAVGASQAQTIYDDPGRYNALQMQAEAAQRDALAAQQAAYAAQARLETETRLSSLAAQRITGEQALQNHPIVQGDQAGAQMNADAARLAELTNQALARSNARVRAIKPALR